VGDQGLGLGEFQLEFLAQKLADLRLDLLGFAPRTGEPEEKIIAIPHIPKPPIAGIVRVLARQTTTQAAKRPHRIPVCVPLSLRDPTFDALVSRFGSAPFASGIFRYQLLFNELVEPVQVNIRQERGIYAPNAMGNFCFDVTLSYRRLERPRRVRHGL
jgi:hypothetical protein